jgi:hypothetical protein
MKPYSLIQINLTWNVAQSVLKALQDTNAYNSGSRNIGAAVEEITVALIKADVKERE